MTKKKAIRFSFTPEGVAGLFLLQFEQSGKGRDQQLKLASLLNTAYHKGCLTGLEKAYDEWIESGSEICKKTEDCRCFPCLLKKAVKHVEEAEEKSRFEIP